MVSLADILSVSVVEAELNILVPLAASVNLLNNATISTASEVEDVNGTT
jgi:hypothetical protein